MHAQIVLFDGFDPLDVIGPYEVLHAGGAASGGAVEVELVSAEGPREVVSGTSGVTLRATARLDPESVDLVLVPGASGRVGPPGERPDDGLDGPGGHQPPESVPVLLGRTLETELPALLERAVRSPRTTVATVCGGSLVLAMSGLLEGRWATTHHLGADLLDATGARAVEARLVEDGDLVTAAGVTSGLDLGLYLLEREVGPRIAHAVEQLFAHERRGTVWRDRGPAPVPH
ncbi:DJ-1/PfpI family protein [Streptomyces sp. P38-E01]|uniref:DJ-1/PfpI family protein n=1 Tax=Streptomyces tardus TaxID=2780544 RepID=A0A949JHE3_9ACTN|nr:DJ-1/PfpI family protein [Streptomyces tardus]MBU7596304.1 DJ-1/PfpI family protein [Streptomyces tardus]